MEEVERHKADCLARWQQLEAEAWQKWRLYKDKRISRRKLNEWLNDLDRMDRRTIKRMYAAIRGGK